MLAERVYFVNISLNTSLLHLKTNLVAPTGFEPMYQA